MTVKNHISENLTKANHSSRFVVGSLLDALHESSAVESLVIVDLIASATKLQTKILALSRAVKEPN